jgi:Holliday junction resolvase
MSTKKSPLESVVRRKIVKALEARGGFWAVIHGSPLQRRGLPDIIGCYRGRYVSFEVKRDAEGKPTPLQEHTMKRIRTEGGVSIRIHTVEQAMLVIDRLDELQVAKARKHKLKRAQSDD